MLDFRIFSQDEGGPVSPSMAALTFRERLDVAAAEGPEASTPKQTEPTSTGDPHAGLISIGTAIGLLQILSWRLRNLDSHKAAEQHYHG